jgi:hypothetical protein
MLRLISLIALGMTGCEQHDYSVQLDESGGGYPIANFPETISARFDISIDVAFQRNNFGQEVSRCQFQVALYYYYQSDLFEEGGEGGEGEEHSKIDFPEQAGQCVLTTFSDSPQRGGRGEREDNWQIRGTIDAGETVFLRGENRDLELVRMHDFGDRVYYDLENCNEDSFPFAQILDLDAPEANIGSEFDALYLEGAIITGPSLTVITPGPELLEAGYVFHPNNQDFEMAWVEEEDHPDLGETQIHHDKVIFLRNSEGYQNHFHFEAIACRPDTDTSMTITAEVLQELTPNANREDEDYYLAVQVDATTIAPESETPWGQLLHSRTMITDGGVVRLYEGEDSESE